MITLVTSFTVGARSTLHLVHPSSGGKPLCGTTLPDAEIGSYTERLDGEKWVREVLGHSGRQAAACERCLSLHPSVLL